MTQENRIIQHPEVRNLTEFSVSSSIEPQGMFPRASVVAALPQEGDNSW